MLMRRKVLMGLGALCLMAGASPQVRADFNTNTPPVISWNQFSTAGYTAVNSPLVQSFTYSDGGTGTAVSQVYQSGNTYAYLYQIQVPSTGNNNDVGQFQVNWKYSAFASASIGNTTSPVYELTSQGGTAQPSAFYLPATTNSGTQVADATNLQGSNFNRIQATYPSAAGLDTSIVVVFSTIAPTVVPIRSIQDGSGLTPPNPEVYVPAPEPPAVALCCFGVLGLFGGAAYRRFRLRPSMA
jgi:hypothetical protein